MVHYEYSIVLYLIQFNLFLFVWSRRGLWPTGCRTCQFHL